MTCAPYHITSVEIASVEKIWTLVNYISWCLTNHMAVWTKFVNGSEGISEYLLFAMWSFGHLFGCKNVRRWCFLWFWGMTFSGANKITGSFLKHMWSVGMIRYCLLKFKKLSWFQIWEMFLVAIFLVLVAKKIVFFSLTKATLYLKIKKIWVIQYAKVPILSDSCRQWLIFLYFY